MKEQPLRLRKFNSKTKSKVIADVCWSKLSGNKTSYLSVNIIQVVREGKTLTTYYYGDDKGLYDSTIKEVAPDIYDLYKSRLSNPDGSGLHQVTNSWYFLTLTRKYLFEKPVTVEQKQEELKELKDSVYKDFDKICKICRIKGSWCDINKFKRSLENRMKQNYFDYPSYSHETMLNWFVKTYDIRVVVKKQISSILDNILNITEKVRGLESDLKYSTLKGWVNESEIWTVERLAKYLELEVNYVKETILFLNSEEDLKELLQPKIESNKNRLKELTEKYNIPTIYS